MEGIQVITGDFVNIAITKSDTADFAPVERRYKKGMTVADFKSKLELITGGNAETMKLKLYDSNNKYVCDIDNNDALLGSYPIDDGMRVEVVDKFTLLSSCDTSDSSERFQLSEEEYQKKQDTLRSFLQRNKLGKYNEEEMAKLKEQQQKELEEEESLAQSIPIGSRCEVRMPRQPARRATVRYKGALDGARGVWLGVHYDEPRGKNDGEVNGKRYFTCPPNYGGFVKPVYVTVGDFPVEEDGLDEI